MEDLTEDSLFNGDMIVRQPKNGYRFSIDAVLLAHYAGLRAKEYVLDLGTGCGIIPLILAKKNPKLKIYGIEIQESLAEIALLNVIENQMQDRIFIRCADMKSLHRNMFGDIDTVVCNPPYRKVLSGRMNPDTQKAIARHEIRITLADIAEIAKQMLSISGRFIVIYPAERTVDLLFQMRKSQIEPKHLRFIHSMPDTESKLLIAEGIRGACSGIRIEKPLIIYKANDDYTDEMKMIFDSANKSDC